MKIKVTSRKYEGDDRASWAIFRSDKPHPVYTGLTKPEIPYYKKLVEEIIKREQFAKEDKAGSTVHAPGCTCGFCKIGVTK